ncbi:MAG TPA: histidine phosphatase family protein [Cytophagaceae bacterium]|jgi:probable phosphoglycerate mutase
MSVKRIYLIRHGQTDYNLKGIVQGGSVDTDLNETGLQQSKAFFDVYKDLPFDKVYTSSLKRSIQSVEGFIKKGIVHEKYAGLNEISWGEKDGKLATIDDNSVYLEIVTQWKAGNVDAKIEGGESPREVQNRQKPVIDLIFSRNEEDLILICMHGRAIRILLSTLLDEPLGTMDKFEHNNLGLYILSCSGTMCTIEKFNDTEHLNNLRVN